ncbi:peptidyl-prolyl cis-trans isomerase [Sediminitomix flava]|uniref:peptidylprolyl isomerase n=1 Tax=Sediminitomix flava TaxID=379075 RepID=A0A315YWD7_SEDFL|nr:peptidylprolyl isomerase [Sediminitomix flava]PWJ34195.1 parvulin-like peptidyl-prolyl cis-trans isomerase protein [Sediminitomix flava]
MQKFWKEPLLHFALIGGLIFLVYQSIGLETDQAEDEIHVDSSDLKEMIAKWEMQWKRKPTSSEFQKLIDQFLQQEVFYREALKINLDHNDEIIRRRLAQKMQFLSNDFARMTEPTESELESYFKTHLEEYRLPAKYSLYQLTFTGDHRENPIKDAKELLSDLENLPFDEVEGKGDQLSFPFYYEKVSTYHLGRQLGEQFVRSIESVETEKWIGPVTSGLGMHLVFIKEKVEAPIPSLNQVKDDVLRDWRYEREKESAEEIYHLLKEQYKITVDELPEENFLSEDYSLKSVR